MKCIERNILEGNQSAGLEQFPHLHDIFPRCYFPLTQITEAALPTLSPLLPSPAHLRLSLVSPVRAWGRGAAGTGQPHRMVLRPRSGRCRC